MTDTVLLLVFVAGWLIVAISAIGSRTLMNFSHRQLEVFCRLRRRRELFGHILDLHDEVALAVEKLEALGLIVLISSGTLLWEKRPSETSTWVIGAGLTIVRKIVERHKGKIWVESDYGEGSTFYFTLERANGNAAKAEPAHPNR